MHGWCWWTEISQLLSHFFGFRVLRGNSRAVEKYHKVVKDQLQLQVGVEDLIQESPFTAIRGNSYFLKNLLLFNLFWNWNCYLKSWVGLAAHCSKANKQVRLVERKICFISDGSKLEGEGWNTSVQRLTPPQGTSGARAFIDRSWVAGMAATCSNSSFISDSHLQIGPWWSDQHHIDCFGYS